MFRYWNTVSFLKQRFFKGFREEPKFIYKGTNYQNTAMAEICILLSKENQILSEAEAKTVLNFPKTKLDMNLLKVESNKEIIKNLNKTAYSRMAFEILVEEDTYPNLEKTLENSDLNLKKSKTFGIRTLNLTSNKSNFDVIKVSKLIYSDSIGEVDLKKPEQEFYLILAKRAYFTKLIWTNQDKFAERKANKRPSPHPTSMNPKLARALINLANPKKEVLDPFCGSGGILLEAGVLGLKSIGLDIDENMILRSKDNLKHYNIKESELLTQSALDWTTPVECVVTDVPYGKSSKLKEELKGLIKKFLTHYHKLTKIIVLVAPKTMDAEKIAKSNGWNVKNSFFMYVHSNLTRQILILEKSL